MGPLITVLAFPFILMWGYGAAWWLSGRDVRALNGRAGLLLYASLLAIPLLAALLTRPELSWDPAPLWAIGGGLAGWALWHVRRLMGGLATTAPVWVGAPGWAGYLWLMVPVAYIVTAEEVVWRGYLLPKVGLVLSSLAFAAHHYFFGLRHTAFSFLAGLAWGGLFLGSGSLVPPVASHLVYNALAWRYMRSLGAHSSGTSSEPSAAKNPAPSA
jgi:membrane protease YdiL (CAAX protease family)